MYLEDSLATKLMATTAVYNLVGNRVYCVEAPQNVTTPYLVIQKISELPTHSHDGYSHLKEARIQFSAFSPLYLTVKAINKAIFDALDSYKGLLCTGGISVQSAFFDDEVDLYDAEAGLHYTAVDYIVSYND
jgi:hypothetical protein